MDRVIYLALSGAQQAFEQQAVTENNVANVSTPGFRAQLSAYRQVPVVGGSGDPTRVFVTASTPGADFTPGPIMQTGRPLDVAVQGDGWLAVNTANGGEAYTRAGDIQINPDGGQLTINGLPVMGSSGPLAVPPGAAITIAKDGTISALGQGDPPNSVAVIGQLKLVNPPTSSLVRGDDGLFRLASGQPAPADPNVTVLSGALEGSNVNPVTGMVDMIAQARDFQMHMKVLQNADTNDQSANQLLSFN